MNFLREVDEMMMSSSSSSEEEYVRNVQSVMRRKYRNFARARVDDFDEVDFRKYFRLNKETFWRLHAMVRDSIEGDLRRYVSTNFLCFNNIHFLCFGFYF